MLEILTAITDQIIWEYCAVVVLMGYLWKYRLKIEHPDVKWAVFFLAILAAVMWWLFGGPTEAREYFISYLFITSFYDLVIMYVFNWVESKFSSGRPAMKFSGGSSNSSSK